MDRGVVVQALAAVGATVWCFWLILWSVIGYLAQVFSTSVVFLWMGSNALFLAKPIAWLGTWLTVMIPYYIYQKKRL